jgi:hypothetical protein
MISMNICKIRENARSDAKNRRIAKSAFSDLIYAHPGFTPPHTINAQLSVSAQKMFRFPAKNRAKLISKG